MRKLALLFALMLATACGGDDKNDPPSSSSGGKVKSGDAGSSKSKDGGGQSDGGVASDDEDGDDDEEPGDDMKPGSGDPKPGDGGDAAVPMGTDPGAMTPADAGTPPLNDAGILEARGSCCIEHDTPGCANPDLMVCVCERDSTCCTEGWHAGCVLTVESKWCQPEARECICNGEEWAGLNCCAPGGWTSACQTVFISKCDGAPGCF